MDAAPGGVWGEQVSGRMKLELHISRLKPRDLAGRDLADALEELHKLLGSPNDVHFTEIRKGSTVIVAEVGLNQISGARQRMADAASGSDPTVKRHFDKLNQIVSRAGTSAKLQEIRRNDYRITRLEFPGSTKARPKLAPVRDRVTVMGRLYRIEGKDKSIHAGLDDDGTLYSLILTLAQAKEAAAHLFRQMRVDGEALLTRADTGRWVTGEISVDRLEPIEEVSLHDTIVEMRTVGGFGWRDAPPGLRELVWGSGE